MSPPGATMTAAVMRERPAVSLDLASVPAPRPQAFDEIVIKVDACGICGTDFHILDGEAYLPTLPFVLGHEIVGRVERECGSAERVAVWPFLGCGTCGSCRQDLPQLCIRGATITGVVGTDGGLAEYVLARRSQLVPVPLGLTSPAAAALVDAGTTALNAVSGLAGIPSDGVLVVGGGPIGFCVSELLAAEGRDFTLIERSEKRREIARTAGFSVISTEAELAFSPGAVIDCADGSAMSWALDLLRPRGTFVAVAYDAEARSTSPTISHKELQIRGVRSGSRKQLREVLELGARGILGAFPIRQWPLADVGAAISAIRSGRDSAKAVIVGDDSRPG